MRLPTQARAARTTARAPRSDHDRTGDDSIGDIVRRAFGMDDGSGEKASEPRKRPDTRWGNGRGPWHGPGEQEPTKTDTSADRDDHRPRRPTRVRATTKPTEPPGQPGPNPQFPQSGGGGGGGTSSCRATSRRQCPICSCPVKLQPAQPGVPGGTAALEAGAGVVAAVAPVGAAVPIALPVIVAPPLGLGIGGGGGGAGAGPRTGPAPDVKSIFAQPPAGRSSPPANVGSNAAVPNASYRIGYTEYLRTAGLPQVAALAVPGLVGIMVLTGAGGLVGYRQAKAGHAVRVGGSARFMR